VKNATYLKFLLLFFYINIIPKKHNY